MDKRITVLEEKIKLLQQEITLLKKLEREQYKYLLDTTATILTVNSLLERNKLDTSGFDELHKQHKAELKAGL